MEKREKTEMEKDNFWELCKWAVGGASKHSALLPTFGNQKSGHFHHSGQASAKSTSCLCVSVFLGDAGACSPGKFLNFLCLESLKMPQIYQH